MLYTEPVLQSYFQHFILIGNVLVPSFFFLQRGTLQQNKKGNTNVHISFGSWYTHQTSRLSEAAHCRSLLWKCSRELPSYLYLYVHQNPPDSCSHPCIIAGCEHYCIVHCSCNSLHYQCFCVTLKMRFIVLLIQPVKW